MVPTAMTQDYLAPAGRLEKVETQNLRLKRVLFSLLTLGGTALLMGQAKPESAVKVIEAERLVLRDADGKVRAELGTQDRVPSLALFDEKGKRRTSLAVAADGSSSLSLYDEDGNSRAVLRVGPDGEAHLQLSGKQGNPRTAPPNGVAPLATSPVRPAEALVSPERDERFAKTAVLYRRLCASCHGSDGRAARLRSGGSSIPDFTGAAWQASRTDAQLAASILNGRGADMPAFDDRVSVGQARELVAYIRALGPAGVKPAAGAASDYDRQFQQLQQQLEELQRQMQGPRKP